MAWRSINPHNLNETVTAVPPVPFIFTASNQPPTTLQSLRAMLNPFAPSRLRPLTIADFTLEARIAIFKSVAGDGLAVGVENGVAVRKGNYYRRLFRLLHVCHLWRIEILGEKGFWKYARKEDHPAITSMAFMHADGLEMVFDLWETVKTGTPHYQDPTPFLIKVVQSQSPIAGLFVHCNLKRLPDTLITFLRQENYEVLQSSWVFLKYKYPKDQLLELTLFGGQHPRLVDLAVDVKANWTLVPTTCFRLQRLSLSGANTLKQFLPKQHELIVMLSQMPNLRELELDAYDCGRHSTRTELEGVERVTLEHLKSLKITRSNIGVIIRILPKIETPSCIVTELTTNTIPLETHPKWGQIFAQQYAHHIETASPAAGDQTTFVWLGPLDGFEIGGRRFSFSRKMTWDNTADHARREMQQHFDDLLTECRNLNLPFLDTIHCVSLTAIEAHDIPFLNIMDNHFHHLRELQIDGNELSVRTLKQHLTSHLPGQPPCFPMLNLLYIIIRLSGDQVHPELPEHVETIVRTRRHIRIKLDASKFTGSLPEERWKVYGSRVRVTTPTQVKAIKQRPSWFQGLWR